MWCTQKSGLWRLRWCAPVVLYLQGFVGVLGEDLVIGLQAVPLKEEQKISFCETFCAMLLMWADRGIDAVGVKAKQLRSVLLPLTCQGSPCPPQLRCPAGDCPSQTARFHCRETMVHLWHMILLSETQNSHWLEQWEEAGLHFVYVKEHTLFHSSAIC